MSTVLFLCTGNYYRSRFAEVYFNWLAEQAKLAWRADSRGLALVADNPGPISQHALEGLERRGIPIPGPVRFPRELDRADLVAAELIVAVKEREHRPLIQKRFPEWVERIEFWHVHDLDHATADEALPGLEQCVRSLFDRLHISHGRCR